MMIKRIAQVCLALAVVVSALSFSVAAGPNSGGVGGGGSNKPVTIRWAGNITNIQTSATGTTITLGTSYYAVGVGIVSSNTKIKLNGASNSTLAELRLGDFAEMDVLWPSRVISKMEVTGVR